MYIKFLANRIKSVQCFVKNFVVLTKQRANVDARVLSRRLFLLGQNAGVSTWHNNNNNNYNNNNLASDEICVRSFSLGRILNTRLPSVRESLRKEIPLLRVSLWGEISFFASSLCNTISLCREITSQYDFLTSIDHIRKSE